MKVLEKLKALLANRPAWARSKPRWLVAWLARWQRFVALWRRFKLSERFFRAGLAFSLCIVVVLFVRILGAQNKSYDVNARMDTLRNEQKIHEVGEWSMHFFQCENTGNETGACEELETPGQATVTFPAAEKLPAIIGALSAKPTKVLLKHKLTQAERAWLAEAEHGALVLPRSVQNRARALLQASAAEAYGIGANLSFSFRSREVLDQGELALELDITDFDWFGPADLPAVLARSESVDEYLSLSLRQLFAASLTSQMEIGFPVLLAAVAIVLDHSTVFGLASLYAAARAARSFINFSYTEGLLVPEPWNQNLLYACNGLVFALLVIFAIELSGLRKRVPTWSLGAFALTSALGSILWGRFDKNYPLTSDLWADALSTSLCVPIVLLGCYLSLRQNKKSEKSKGDELADLGKFLFVARAALLLGGISIHAWINWQELSKLSSQELRNPLDWKHSMLFPVLITVALFEVGSVARKMLGFAKSMAEGALLEQEVELARDMQQRMLPARKFSTGLWEWRAFYYPASALAGDWFDVREVEFRDGTRFLAVCVVDITGHGVGPALVTSTLCAQWSLWCMDLQKLETAPPDPAAAQEHLAQAAHRMHQGLCALGKGDACTAALALFDPCRAELTYSTCGHPGLMLQQQVDDGKVKYLRTAGNSLGVTAGGDKTPSSWPAATTSIAAGTQVCVYSDGLVPLDVTVTTWARQVERQVKKEPGPLVRHLARQLRLTKRMFHSRPGEEDDITLVAIHQRALAEKPLALPTQPEVEQGSTQTPVLLPTG